ncbi:helix-turn-helix domain-containing protein [Cytophaga hutchinsonii]|uniref:Transcriptional regulator, AraC family n=1 Tax=Cytophaga hutchinsonii (strain ATCC 33406 / DSM 1761 / CIP 103989 / NBRC 15051 / NCIMB 9469 / D465) TaxID=269798 RepID=A0A6N4SW22_CYTH3|nr:helix-turn-helix transcriptional regulator [Cytophaga hutchinsonii]ABG60492.1 transcriptional regulator, AraC family [Cytophaga hutchinsonii ATCC 33406]SFX84806.1 transcriptional regulator, AraC family [Cytophaga hutchinsonii ATCC 33406]
MEKHIPVFDICTLSENKEDDILISRLSEYFLKYSNLHFPHRHSFYHLIFFTKGSGSHSIDFDRFDVQQYQIYFMIPGQVHTWEFEGEVEGYVVNFSTAFFQSFLLRPEYIETFSFFAGNTKDGVINLPKEKAGIVQTIFEELVEQSNARKDHRWDMIRVLLLKIFITIEQKNVEENKQDTTSYNYALLKNFQKLIEKNYKKLKLPMEYAELLYITPNHLNGLCKDYTGIAAGELIRNRIILEAKRMLINQHLSIAEIAYELNFKDNSYFTKFFKKQVGVTPEEFRKKSH